MTLQRTEWMWLDDSDTVTLVELSRASGMTVADVDELVEYGALLPLEAAPQERLFSAQCVTQLRTAGKLRLDFDLDLFAVAMILGYLNRIEALERQVRTMEAHRPAQGHSAPLEPVTAIGPAAPG